MFKKKEPEQRVSITVVHPRERGHPTNKPITLSQGELHDLWENILDINNNFQTGTFINYTLSALKELKESCPCMNNQFLESAIIELTKAKEYDAKKFENLQRCLRILEKHFNNKQFHEDVSTFLYPDYIRRE